MSQEKWRVFRFERILRMSKILIVSERCATGTTHGLHSHEIYLHKPQTSATRNDCDSNLIDNIARSGPVY
jgi:hypothetical protein